MSRIKPYTKYCAFLLLLMPFVRVEPAPVDYLIWLGGAFLLFRSPELFWEQLPRYFRWGLLLFTLAHVSIIWAPSLGRSLFFTGATAEMVVIFILYKNVVGDNFNIGFLLDYYILGSSLAALIGILAFYGAIPFSEIFMFGKIRAMAFFQGPNVFGAHLVPALMLTWYQYSGKSVNVVRKLLYPLAAFLLAGGILISGSRTAWGGAVLGLCLFGLLLSWKTGFRRSLMDLDVLPILTLVSLVLVLVPPTGLMLENRAVLIQSYDQQRFNKQREAISPERDEKGKTEVQSLKIAKLLFGQGPGQSEITLDYATHNLYLRVYYELGIVGSLGFLVMAVSSILYLRKYFSSFGLTEAGIVSVLITLMAMGLFIDTLHWRHLFVFLGLAFAWAQRMRHKVSDPRVG